MPKDIEVFDDGEIFMVFKDGLANIELSQALDSSLKEFIEKIQVSANTNVSQLVAQSFRAAIKAVYDNDCQIGDENFFPIATFEELAVVIEQVSNDDDSFEMIACVKRVSELSQ